MNSFNTASFLVDAVEGHADQRALIYRSGRVYESLTFAELGRRVDGYAHALTAAGVSPGQKVLVLLRGADFVAITFALFKVGAIPSLIDPGMGMAGLLSCVRQLQPEVLIGIPPVFLMAAVCPRSFASVRIRLVVGGRLPAVRSLRPVEGGREFPLAETAPDETAAILFTSGSTGPAKGVVYRHRIFQAQVLALQKMYAFTPGEIDMPGFPLFALFSTALGQTCLLPELNPSRPATVDPARVVDACLQFGAHSLQGSPAIWTRVGRFCRDNRLSLPGVKRVLTFGAPISVELLATWREILGPGGLVHTPYGATEALPVASISSEEVLGETATLRAEGRGTCVGRPAPGISVRIIRIRDEPLPVWSDELLAAPGEVGEIVVAGDVVTWSYYACDDATNAAKIREDATVWHRMGDLGYFDAKGRLWFCGRKGHRIEGEGHTWFSVCGEGMVDPHPGVARSALVGVGPHGHQEPVIVVEPHEMPRGAARERLQKEVLSLLHEAPEYQKVQKVLFHRSFPVDPRHNAKIHREELAAWAVRELP